MGSSVSGVEGLGESGGEVALLRSDCRRVTGQMTEDIIHFMVHNRLDLMRLVGDLTPQQMASVPEGKKRHLPGIHRHVCNAEEFYTWRLSPDAD